MTSDSVYNPSDGSLSLYANCLPGLIDNKFIPGAYFENPSDPNVKCCPSTDANDESGDSWFNIKFVYPSVVDAVIIINEEDLNGSYNDFIIGNDLYVGNHATPNLNKKCNANPLRSGVYSCKGLVGTYLGIYKSTDTYNNLC